MRVLFLRPPIDARRHGPSRRYPLQLAYLSAGLAQLGVSVGFVDCPLRGYDAHAGAGAVFAFHPDVIYAELDPRYAPAQIDFLAAVKELNASRIILGGSYPTLAAENIYRAFPHLDALIRGEPDQALQEVITHWHGGRSAARLAGVLTPGTRMAIAGPPRPLLEDLDALPFPDRDTVPFLRYQAGRLRARPFAVVAGSRGCPRECRFCRRGRTKAGLRLRSPASIAQEVEQLVRARSVREIGFVDAAFNADPDWACRIADAIAPLGIAWHCIATARGLSSEHLRTFRRAGCRDMVFSPVCPTEESAENLRVGDGPETVRKVVDLARAQDIATHVRIITGDHDLPNFQEAREFASYLTDAHVTISQIRPQVGSAMVPDIPEDPAWWEAARDMRILPHGSRLHPRFWRERMRTLLLKTRCSLCAEVGTDEMSR